ncbi:precorrin-6Y C5,15-methyltransferase (decarboxylating) [Paractinoplanes abujensis]|uniref:Precorrin-6Y C5,15-methyltransferase (Decarboxylating) n=1 Tax=Paractinoplanes abujensis TaxID=882441 RepID=A0A7W7CZS0_9ACTN|nr:precorrin-6y C5,15-methyltransferase (decarboxylating) subunit CbiE [Actinoplanes abujensis]MBB4697618.1 precorrin-6Y C5,15-methyltransferase (decarboxylating) [Actinoplanes abujensis]GID19892.1 precorrin-6Y C5,15-methyltransferase (decarboxylating) [Actinoplanes abujensis]
MHADNTGLVTVVGIGAGGWDDLPRTSRDVLTAASVIIGSSRQLSLLPPSVTARRVLLPSPLLPGLGDLLRGDVTVLASGDPMFHGIGATLARLTPRLRVLPHPSSAALAAARLGWPLATTEVLSLVTADPATVRRALNPGRRILVLSRDATTPAQVAALVAEAGYGAAAITVLSQLGGPAEEVVTGAAGSWAQPPGDPLNVVAIDCGDGPATSLVPGLADSSYETDGQLTKREVRAVTLAVLAPAPGALLWDVGAGSGSIGIEWMRSHPTCRAVAVESSAARAVTIRANASALGVPGLRVVTGQAPAALDGLDTPDVVFIGGGLTRPGVLDACLAALRPGGRLVANAVTLESEAALATAYAKLGGELTRLSVSRGSPVGGFTGWRPLMPVTIWSVTP